MKKALSLILALVLCLSLCACGKSTAITKEGMLESAETTDLNTITTVTNDNLAKATQKYCNKTLKVTGFIIDIEADHIRLACDAIYGRPGMDVYLPSEEIAELSQNQLITVVGKTTEAIKERTHTVAGYDWIEKYYEMPQAYLVDDSFEVKVTIDDQGKLALQGPSAYSINEERLYMPGSFRPSEYETNTILKIVATIFRKNGEYDYYVVDYEIINVEALG